LFTATSVGAKDTLTVFDKFAGGNDGDDPNTLIQGSGILYGTTGEPNPAYHDLGSVFSLDAGLPAHS
jgi:hypothetical protein